MCVPARGLICSDKLSVVNTGLTVDQELLEVPGE